MQTSGTTAAGTGQYFEGYAYNPIGNLTSKGGVTQWYSDTTSIHAVTHLNGVSKFTYDANGNMLTRIEGGATYNQAWDAENRLTVVTNTTTSQVTKFVYDGDGARVRQVLLAGGKAYTTSYAGATEVFLTGTLRVTRTYYSANGLVAMRVVTSTGGNVLYFMHNDHLGSTSVTSCGSGGCGTAGALVARQSYLPYGSIRAGGTGTTPTDIGFTGQRLDATGLMFYEARYYSPVTGRFVSPDTIVPEAANPQSWNSFAYVLNNPLRFIDPSGHKPYCAEEDPCITPTSWDEDALANTTSQERRDAEEAYQDFSVNPTKYLSYLANLDPTAFGKNEDVQRLNVYAEGALHISVNELILSEFPGDTADLVYQAQLEKWPAYETGKPLAVGAALPTGGIYLLRNAAGRVMYVGRTINLARRAVEWRQAFPNLRFDIFARTNSRDVLRGLEQIAYDRFRPILNRIRPIRLDNPNLSRYLGAAKRFLLGQDGRTNGK